MKYSIKKNYKHLFELEMHTQDVLHEPYMPIEMYTQDEMKESEAFVILDKLKAKLEGYLKVGLERFTIKFKFKDEENTNQSQIARISYSEIINYTYYLLTQNEISLVGIDSVLQESLFNKKALIKEADSLENTYNFLKSYFNIKDSGKTKVVTKLVNAASLNEFKSNLFYFLFKKLVDKKANLELIDDSDISESVSEIVGFFTDLLKSKQSLLTVNFGAFFEEVFREQVYDYLGISNTFELDIGHRSKKLSIVLIYCCNNIFENANDDSRFSAVFTAINKGNTPTDDDYLQDYQNIRYEDGKGKALVKKKVVEIINSFKNILDLDINDTYCDDFEKDPHFKSVASDNSPFDFIIREKNIQSSNKNIGLFDLKASNKGSAGSPLSKGATGNNGGTNNTALTFINKMTDKIKSINKNQIGISFFGLIQMNFTLDFIPSNNYEISIESLEYKISSAMSSALYSIDKDHFYLTDYENEKKSDFNTLQNISRISDDMIQNYKDLVITDPLDFVVAKRSKIKNAVEDIIEKYNKLGTNIISAFSNLNLLHSSNFEFILNPNNYEAIYCLKNDSIDEISKKYGVDLNEKLQKTINRIKEDDLFDPERFAELIINFFRPGRIQNVVSPKSNLDFFKNEFVQWEQDPKNSKKKVMTKLVLTIFGEENTYENGNVLRDNLKINLIPEEDKKLTNDMYLSTFQKAFAIQKLKLNINDNRNAKIDKKNDAFESIKKAMLDQIKNNMSKIKDERAADASLNSFYQYHGMGDAYIPKGKVLKEVYSHLFKKRKLNEGGLAGHMMHPYEALDMTPKQIKDRIKKYSTSQKIIEKVDGQNLFFTVEEDGTLMFARNKEDMTHDDLVEKFTNHPAEVPFISGGNAIKRGVDQWLSSAGAFGQQEILEIFHPDGEARSFINFEIMHKDHPNQLEYGENFIVFHSIVDFIDGREAVYSSNNSQRLNKLIKLMKPGVESSDYTLASNRTVDLNSLTNVQISDYINRINRVMQMLDITDNEYLGDGVEKQIKKELDAEGITISDEAIKMLYDFALYGEDRLGNKIKSKDFTSLMAPEDVVKLRSIGLTNASKAAAKVRSILSPFKDIFVDLGIDLLDGVASSYMSMDIDLANIDKLRDKLQTAIDDLSAYMTNTPEEEWEPTVKRLKQHYDKVERTGVFDTVSTSVEGGVYDHEGDLLKVTGGFAPLNQILGAAYRDKKGIFPTFKQKFMQQESNRRSLRSVFSSIF